jgi:hypothetical protein
MQRIKDRVPIVLIGLDPEQFLASMKNLRLIADP